MKKIDDFVNSFPFRLFCLKGFIILPSIYIIFWLVNLWEIHLTTFCFLISVGLLTKYIYLRYENDDLDEGEGLKRINKSQSFDWKHFWRAMPTWEWIHWIIVVVFFILTAWAMWSGLHTLFKVNESNDLFIDLFTACVTLTLFWLVIMITRNKHVWGFAFFYIVFDVMSAFTFNFIHFYDNVSETQRNDATIKACQMYLDLEGNSLTTIANDTALQNKKYAAFARYTNKAKNQKNALKTLNDGLNDNLNQKAQKTIDRKTRQGIINYNTDLTDQEKDRETLAYEIIPFKDSLEYICDLYRKNPESLKIEDITKAKEDVRFLYNKITTSPHSNKSIAHRDSVDYALHIIKSKGKNRFESYVELFELLSSSISIKQIESLDSISSDSLTLKRSAVYNNLVKQESRLENGIMFQSIGLSALIDVVPLALSIFVAWCKRKDED